MPRTLEWKHGDFTDTASYVVECRTKKKIGLDDGKDHQKVVSIDKWGSALYQVGQWTVKVDMLSSKYVLTLTRKLPADDRMDVNFEEGTIPSVKVRIGAAERNYEAVSAVVIQPNQVVRVTTDVTPDPGPGPVPGPKTVTRTAVKPADADKQKELEAKLTAAEAEKKELQKKLEAAGKAKKGLEDKLQAAEDRAADAEKLRDLAQKSADAIAGSRIEELMTALKEAKKALSKELQAKLADAEKADGENRALRTDVENAEKDLDAKKAEQKVLADSLTKLKGELADLDMDCEAAGRELETLKSRLGDDEDTAELMREEPLLKDNSALRTLERVRGELEAAEKRMGLVIRLREKLNSTIQQTILSGSGFIPLSEEQGGGEADGDGSGPAEADP